MPVENFRRAGPSENLRGFAVMLQTLHLLLFKRNDYRSVPGGSDFGLRRFEFASFGIVNGIVHSGLRAQLLAEGYGFLFGFRADGFGFGV